MKSKITLGKNCVSGFFSVQDGDIYTLPDGTATAVTSGAGCFWALRYLNDQGKPDFTRPPVPEWENIDGQSAMVHMINREYFLTH
jgi:hypothetical protein